MATAIEVNPLMCGICGEEGRKLVTCSACEYKSCVKCLDRYFETTTEAKCPGCFVVMTQDFVTANTTPKLITRVKKMREDYLLQQEMAMLPESQNDVEIYVRLSREEEEYKQLNIKRKALNKELSDLSERIWHKRVCIGALKNGQNPAQAEKKEAQVKPPKAVCPCPEADCRGFVTKPDYKCGICSVDVCKDCHVLVDEPEVEGGPAIHVCNEEDILSRKEIETSSKMCPNCNARIFKIDGCDQMWCTQCRTAFSWNTGMVEKGTVHNPHYYQWKRDMNNSVVPRVDIELEHAPCDRVTFARLLRAMPKSSGQHRVKLDLFHRAVNHVYHTKRENVQPHSNKDLRVRYLLKEITYEEFGSLVLRRDRMYQRRIMVRDMIDMLYAGSDEIFQRLVQIGPVFTDAELKPFADSIDSLLDVFNKGMNDIASQFQSSCAHSLTFSNVLDVETHPRTSFFNDPKGMPYYVNAEEKRCLKFTYN
jgi:hypothetical protein